MLTIAAIAALVASNALSTLDTQTLGDAQYSVLFARDPNHMGDEPHLRCVVDACGLSDEALVALDAAIWDELADRNDRDHAVYIASLDAIVANDRQIPLAA